MIEVGQREKTFEKGRFPNAFFRNRKSLSPKKCSAQDATLRKEKKLRMQNSFTPGRSRE